jgi:hypothetical protein
MTVAKLFAAVIPTTTAFSVNFDPRTQREWVDRRSRLLWPKVSRDRTPIRIEFAVQPF